MKFSQQEKDWAKSALKKCDDKYLWVAEKHKDGIPYTTGKDGKDYDNRADKSKDWIDADGINWWTNGFWGGVLWHVFEDTGSARIAEIAKVSEVIMDECFDMYYGLHHDVGFMWLPTAVANYKLTGDLDARRRALHAANLLAGRFNPVGKFIRAWNGEVLNGNTVGWAIIDCMLNIPLLYWATQETGDPRFQQIAMMHADTVMKDFIREDGSSNHIVEFDPYKGGVVKTYGGQGYENGSAWTRGQGWAVYGFIASYQQTKKIEYLETAKKVADFCIAHMPESGLIPVDYLQPAQPAIEDSCAAAIIAGGMLEIANECEGAEAEKYRAAGLKIMHALDAHRAVYDDSCDAILKNCTGSYHGEESHHITMVYADYYYIEALTKIAKDGEERKDVYYW
ncbi:MAG: glycoside hydrolase family 88 protein [Faecalibacterium sp.]